jgi:hypothetical protein
MRDERLSPNEYGLSRLRVYSRAPQLIVDDTEVGRAVADLLKSNGLRFKALTITGGDEVHAVGDGRYRVPKRDLVGALGSVPHRQAKDSRGYGALARSQKGTSKLPAQDKPQDGARLL